MRPRNVTLRRNCPEDFAVFGSLLQYRVAHHEASTEVFTDKARRALVDRM
jgi:hypothetical protein